MSARREVVVAYLVLTFFSLIALLPLLAVVVLALQPEGTTSVGLRLPSHIDLGNFARAWTIGHLSDYMRSSVIVTVAVVVVVTPLTVAAGYAFGIMSFPGRDALFYTLLLGLVVPFEAAIVPLFQNLRAVGLDNTYYSLILPQIGIYISFGVFWMRAFFRSIPVSLVEAARIDGARSFTILRLVLLPMAKSALLTQALLIFMWSWNEFLLPLVMVSNSDKQTAPLGLTFFIHERTTDQTGLAAAAVLVALPVVIVYILLQRSFMRGMFAGAMKE